MQFTRRFFAVLLSSTDRIKTFSLNPFNFLEFSDIVKVSFVLAYIPNIVRKPSLYYYFFYEALSNANPREDGSVKH